MTTTTNPTPSQQETLERFVLDKSDCVDGGDGCKAEMRHSIAGAFVYHSEIEKARAAVAGPSLESVKEVIKSVEWSSDKSDPETMSTPNKDLGRYMKDVLVAVENVFAAPTERTEVAGEQEPQLHWPFAAKHANCAECNREYEPPPISDSARLAAEETAQQIVEILGPQYPQVRLLPLTAISSIAFLAISKYFAAPADNDAESERRNQLPSPAQQALQIVTAWRAVVGGDDLLIHYIKQAIEENRATATKGDR